MFASRLGALLGALSFSLLISGCDSGRLHILIPDFLASGVDGLRLFRLLEGGSLQAAGRVEFGAITTGSDGLQQMEYRQIVPGKATWGPLMARVKRPKVGQVELEMALFNSDSPAFFRFASYNEKGMSAVADGEVYVGTSR